eukprot:3873299-Prymnesium_polylepis.2
MQPVLARVAAEYPRGLNSRNSETTGQRSQATPSCQQSINRNRGVRGIEACRKGASRCRSENHRNATSIGGPLHLCRQIARNKG